MELVAEGEDALLGTALFLVTPCTAECSVKLVLVECGEQCLRLHQVGMHLRPMGEGADAGLEGFLVALDNEVPSVLGSVTVAELYHLAELPLRIDVHKGERDFAGRKGLLGKTYHDARILSDGIEHHRVFEFRCHFADNIYGLGFELLQMTEAIVF